MPQVAIYLDDATAKRLDAEAERSGKSRSAFVREALQAKFGKQFPESWFELFGSWQDDRTAGEIMRDIREGSEQAERAPFP